jgi:hypothetical protein
MKQESTHHIQSKTYPLNPQIRAYYAYHPDSDEQEMEYKDASHQDSDDIREWQNPSRFARHRS